MRTNGAGSGLSRLIGAVVALLLVVGAAPIGAAIPASERQALIDLYNATNGASWTIHTNWNGAVGTECTWYGVTCDGSLNTVIMLILTMMPSWGRYQRRSATSQTSRTSS